jgi:large-conductance mechanosensitive channel
MLGDVKSFFTKSTVGEVAVGLSVGAAFTNVMASVTEMGRGLFHGQFEYGDVVQSLVALLAAVLFSLVLVVKPLAKLKAAADRSQVALVAEATQEDTAVTGPLADEGADDGLVAGTSADPTGIDGQALDEDVDGSDDVDEPILAGTGAGAEDPTAAAMGAEADAEAVSLAGLAGSDAPVPDVAADDAMVGAGGADGAGFAGVGSSTAGGGWSTAAGAPRFAGSRAT